MRHDDELITKADAIRALDEEYMYWCSKVVHPDGLGEFWRAAVNSIRHLPKEEPK